MQRGGAANQLTGFPEAHAAAFQQVANNWDCVILCREVGQVCTQLIEEGYGSKGFFIKAKSCNWGPMAGFVLANPMFSKRRRVDRAKQQTDIDKALAKGAEQTPLFISDDRRQYLEANAGLLRISNLRKVYAQNRLEEIYLEATSHDGEVIGFKLAKNIVRNRAGLANGLPRNDWLWEVLYQDKFGNYSEVLALTDPLHPVVGYRGAVTGDYDLFAVFPNQITNENGNIGFELFEMDMRPADIGRMDGEHPDLGNVTPRLWIMIDNLNEEIQRLDGFKDRKMVHHSDEGGRPGDPELSYPIIGFIPKDLGGAYGIEKLRDLKAFLRQINRDYVVTLNTSWQKDLGDLGFIPQWATVDPVYRRQMTPRKERLSMANSIFPYSASNYTTALSEDPVLLNGMKVIFDQSAAVYPVNLKLREASSQSFRASQPVNKNGSYSTPFADGGRGRANAIDIDNRIGNLDAITVQGDWNNKDLPVSGQYWQDIKLWLNTIYPLHGQSRSEMDTQKSKIIQRIFSLLRFGGLKYRISSKDDNNWQLWDKPIAAALSHGGRVLIRIHHKAYGQIYSQPAYQHRHRVWNWLVAGEFEGTDQPMINEQARLRRRTAATHKIKFDRLTGPHEVKLGQITAIQSGHYGMNIPLGGEGGKNALDQPILANGKHGHLYLRHDLAPDDSSWDCAIMIGCETTRPDGFEGESGEGHLGTSHSWIGSPQSISATGGKKWEDIDEENTPGKNNCIRVDIDGIDKLLAVTTFNQIDALPNQFYLNTSDLNELIRPYTQVNVAESQFELHPDYRETVKSWLQFQPASEELFQRP